MMCAVFTPLFTASSAQPIFGSMPPLTTVFGAGQYAMRLWVKPDQLAKLQITVPEIVSAIQSQNTVNPAGQVGNEPAPKGQEYSETWDVSSSNHTFTLDVAKLK